MRELSGLGGGEVVCPCQNEASSPISATRLPIFRSLRVSTSHRPFRFPFIFLDKLRTLGGSKVWILAADFVSLRTLLVSDVDSSSVAVAALLLLLHAGSHVNDSLKSPIEREEERERKIVHLAVRDDPLVLARPDGGAGVAVVSVVRTVA